MKRRARVAFALAVLCLPAPAVAQVEADDATKNAARELAVKGRKAMDAGDFTAAADYYGRAADLVKAPSLYVRHARALERAGRLVEAAEAYVRTFRFEVDANSPDAFKQAVADARKELTALRPRIPRLTIHLEGDGADDAEVKLDGRVVQRALVGVEQPVDPGEHTLTATAANGGKASAKVELKEGGSETVVLKLTGGKVAAAGVSGSAGETRDDGGAAASAPPASDRTLAWVGFGVGAAGLATGVVTGLMAASKHSDAESKCPDGRCVAGSSGEDDVESFRSLRTISTVGYVVGVVGAAAGAYFWITAPKQESVAVGVGPGSVAVGGRF